MAFEKFMRILRTPLITGIVVAVVAIASLTAIPEVRTRISSNLEFGANFFLFDDDEARDNVQPGAKKPNAFKRIFTAPVRVMARLFRKKDDNVAAMKKISEKDMEKVKVVPMSRTRDGLQDQIADSGGITREATTAEAASQNLFDDAVELHDRNRLDSAIEKLVAATVLHPNFAEAYNLLAVCYDEKGQYKAAQDEYKKALQVESNNARFLNNLGYSYYLSGDYGNAVKWYGKGIKVTPNDRRMHNNIGLAYGRKGDFKKAREHFVIAVGETGADLNLGYVYSQQGRFDDAIRHYESALKAQPQSLSAMSNLSQLYERTGRLREAGILSEQFKKLSVSAQQKQQTVDQQQ